MKQSSKRLMSLFLSFIFMVAAFVLFFELVEPTYNEMQGLRSNQLGEENYLSTQTALVKQVQTTLNTYQNEAQGAANVALAMPSGEDVAGALAQLEGISTNNGITIESISVTTPAIQTQTTAGGANAASPINFVKPLENVTFRIAASGSYESFKNFLSEIETNIRIFDVKTVSLQPASGIVATNGKSPLFQDMFSYSLTVAAYYQKQ